MVYKIPINTINNAIKNLTDYDLKPDLSRITEIFESGEKSKENIAILDLMREKYRPEDYGFIFPFFYLGHEELKEDFKQVHDSICFLLYD